MTLHRIAATGVLVTIATAVTLAQPSSARVSDRERSRALCARGLELGFNLDHDEALGVFNEAIAADPGDPMAPRLVAATLWTRTLIRQGAVTADDFLGQAGSTLQPVRRSLGEGGELEAAIARAVALAESRRLGTADPSQDAEALFETGAAYSLLASYTATVGGGVQKSLSAARHAYRDHERVLALDPRRTDAGLVVGMYRYAVSVLPLWSRLLARIAGFDSDRATGLRLVEDASKHPGDFQTSALFSLIVIYNREARYDAALDVNHQLQQRYPRNRLLWLEEGSTAIRAERFEVARAALQRGLAMLAADPRPRAFGELARWHYHLGVALARLRQPIDAERALVRSLGGDSLDWVRGRTYLELAALQADAGSRVNAFDAYRLAARFCAAGADRACTREALEGARKVQQ